MTKDTQIKLLVISNIASLIILLIVLIITTIIPSSQDYYVEPAQNIDTSYKKPSILDPDPVPVGKKVFIADSNYNIRPGYTFVLDKSTMKLYADITSINNGEILSVYGKEFHMENEMADACINDMFTRGIDGIYYNTDRTITIENYDGIHATFKDYRTTVALPFNGKLTLIPSNKETKAKNIIIQDEPKEEESVSEDTIEVSENEIEEDENVDTEDDVIVDEYYSDIVNYSGTYVGHKFKDFINPNYEQNDLVITAKYIDTTEYNGLIFEDIHSNIRFYVFGSAYPYDSSTCNTVTITATYRGTESHFNGLYMDGSYPCFVIKNMRKPALVEVKEDI